MTLRRFGRYAALLALTAAGAVAGLAIASATLQRPTVRSSDHELEMLRAKACCLLVAGAMAGPALLEFGPRVLRWVRSGAGRLARPK